VVSETGFGSPFFYGHGRIVVWLLLGKYADRITTTIVRLLACAQEPGWNLGLLRLKYLHLCNCCRKVKAYEKTQKK
jgi:hypothetical protein